MPDPTRAWIALVVLSAASTALAVAVASGGLAGLRVTLAGAAILALAWGKAQLILDAYLGLAAAPAFRRGMALVMTLYALLLLGLYLGA